MDASQQRTLIAILCKVAWADGIVQESERDHVRALVQKLGGVAVSERELDSWLERGAPEVDESMLTPELGERAFEEALKLMRADGDVAEEEHALVFSLLTRAIEGPSSKPLARVRLVKRGVPVPRG